MYDKTEFFKVARYLTEKGIKFVVRPLYDGCQLYVLNDEKEGSWAFDVILHGGSYGHEKGLLEVMGISKCPYDSVEGYLTGEAVIERIKEIYLGE